MGITTPVYANRESVKRALDIMDTARSNDQIDRLLQATARSIDGDLNRTFYPWNGVRKFDWIATQSPTPWRLWLDNKELISVNTLVSGGSPIIGYFLYPDTGPPYDRIEIDLSGQSTFTLANTWQKTIVITGVWGGCPLDTTNVGGLVADINSSVSTMVVPDGSQLGIGDLLILGTEYMLVTARGWLTSTQTLQSSITASSAAVGVTVTDGTAFSVGEIILLDTEQCWIVDIAGNTLMVRRAFDGSVLASHNGSTIYVSRSMTVIRGALGTIATSHLMNDPILRFNPPLLITQRNVAETLAAMEQEKSAYARVVGSGDHMWEAKGVGLTDIRSLTVDQHGRKARSRAV